MAEWWQESDDPTDTGVPVDSEYIDVEDRRAQVGYTDGGNPVIDDSSGAGSSSEQATFIDANSREHDWGKRVKATTTFYVADAPDASRWQRLWQIQAGYFYKDRSDVGRFSKAEQEEQETREMAEAICGSCRLSAEEQSAAVDRAVDIDGRRWCWAGGRPAMILGAVAQTVAESAADAKSRLLSGSVGDTTGFEETANAATQATPEQLIDFAFDDK